MDRITQATYDKIFTVGKEKELLVPFLSAAGGKKILDLTGMVKSLSRTLVAKAFNKGRHDKVTMTAMRLYPYAQYSAIMDNKVCDLCKALDKHIISTTDKRFQDNTFTPPVHNHCRCSWMFIKQGKNVKANWNFDKDFLINNKGKAHLKSLKWAGLIASGLKMISKVV
jgi:SPP1 gp7 family putative phage head morphogenesis protein